MTNSAISFRDGGSFETAPDSSHFLFYCRFKEKQDGGLTTRQAMNINLQSTSERVTPSASHRNSEQHEPAF